ncbi:hypothetical protein GCM10011492_31160 [Flexivirga endophytica]|uniref:DUF559 domain-containing protein n=1 Tax=Flexivirga endophytica TaxID=1849103 RepID=A0A916TC00_9MICO|nr:hypothetical protein GCM10011492_31160 [Flexivirga endophytica]GHB46167.1 hypothetical protein GCM10008112_13550 [Flexivirga endophytica]
MSETFDPRVPFRSASGRKQGLSRREMTGKRFRRVHRDCYVSAEHDLDFETRALAALEMVPGAYGLSHQSAVTWCGGIAPDTPDIHLAVPHRLRCELPGIRVHRYRTAPLLWTRRGVRVTAPAQTFTDLGATTDLVDLVVAGDSLVRRTSVTPSELAAFARQAHSNGVGRARQASEFVRADVDSAQESRSRMLIVLAGLPEPTVNLRFYTAEGALLRRMDMGYKAIKVAVEYDGRQHIERKANWGADIGRREYFEGLGWRFIILIASDIWTIPGRTVRRVHDILGERGAKLGPVHDDWRLHFPDRGGFDVESA